jgi:hypothetical protein
MTRPPRNPRRAYDADGREIRPMSLGNMREHGVRFRGGALPGGELRALGLAELGRAPRRLRGA